MLVNGSTNTVYGTIDLSSAGSLASRAVSRRSPARTSPCRASALKLDPVWTQDQIQNGAPDGLAVIDSVTHTVIDALSYEGSITAATIPDFPAPVSLVEGTALPTAVADSNTVHALAVPVAERQRHEQRRDRLGVCATLTPGAANAP